MFNLLQSPLALETSVCWTRLVLWYKPGLLLLEELIQLFLKFKVLSATLAL